MEVPNAVVYIYNYQNTNCISLSYPVYFVSRLDMFFVRNKENALKL